VSGGAPSSPDELERLDHLISTWMAEQLAGNPAVAAVERDHESGQRRWFVRLHGEQKDVFSVWFHLDQRNLHVETYVMPAPEERAGELYEHLLRRNLRLDPFAFAIGDEDAIFLVTSIANSSVDEGELDRLLGSAYEYTELCFRPAMRIGFASRFRG
jgi:hypothetical protein